MSILRMRIGQGLLALAVLFPAISQAQAVDITVFHENASVMTPIHQEIARRLKEQHPEINVTFQTAADYSEMLQRNLRDALSNSLPDIAFHGHNNISILADRGLAADLDPFIANEPDWGAQGVLQAVQDVGKIDGRTYAVPFTLSIPVVYFNVDLVRKAGGDPDKLPTTWPDILALAEKIEAPSGGIFFTYNSTGSWTFMSLIQSFGADVLTPDHRDIAFDSPVGKEAISVLGEVGKIRKGQDMTQPQARQAFAAGTIGIMVDTSSRLVAYETAARENFELRAIPFPLKDGVDAHIPPSGTSAVIMTTDTELQKAAWEYLKVATSPEMQAFVVEKSGFLPASTAAFDRDDLLGKLFGEDSNWHAAVERMPNLTAWFPFPGRNSVEIDREVTEGLRTIVSLEKEPSVGLDDMAKAARALLTK